MKKVNINNKNGVVLQTANKYLDDDVFVTVDESIMGGGGVEINGLIEEYKVYAGENINAGDFIAFINNVCEELNSASNSCYLAPSCVLLEDNKVFIAHSYGSSQSLCGTIVTFSGTEMTTNVNFLHDESYSCYSAPSCVLLEPNKVFIAYSYSKNFNLYGAIVTINGTSMNATFTPLDTTTGVCYYAPSCVLLEDNKVFIAHSHGSSTTYLYGTIVTIDGTTMTATVKQLNTTKKSCYYAPSCVLIEPNKVFIAHSYSTSTNLYGTIVTINGTTMTATATKLKSTSNSCYGVPSCVLLEPNKVFIGHTSSTSYYLSGTIVTIDGTTMTATTTQLHSDSNSCYKDLSCILLEPNKVFITHPYSNSCYLYGTIVTIDGTTMTATVKQLNTTKNSCYKAPSCVLLEDNKVLIGHSSSGYCLSGTIYFGDKVKQVTDTIKGVAKTSGTSGDTIQVYVPNNS
jgi:hypothetical protein